MRFQCSGPPQKRGFGCTCILCLPRPERLWQPGLGRTLPGCGTPFPSAVSGSRQPEAWAPSPRVRRAFSLCGERPGQPEAWAPSPQVRRAFSLRGPSARRRLSGLRKSLDRNRGPVCRVGGGGFSGAEFAPFPSPLPPTSSGDGPALLWSFSVPLFCEPQAVCSGRLVFSIAFQQFKRAPSDCSQGLWAGPYPKQCLPLLSVPPLFVGGECGRLGYFSSGSCF